jgi:mRNA interferase MazF
MTDLPDRGSLVWVEFSPHAGHEQAGRRPAVVLSRRLHHEHSKLAIVCPITSKERGWPTEVKLPEGLQVSGVIQTDHIRAIDREARYMKIIGQVPQDVLDEINAKLAPLLSL